MMITVQIFSSISMLEAYQMSPSWRISLSSSNLSHDFKEIYLWCQHSETSLSSSDACLSLFSALCSNGCAHDWLLMSSGRVSDLIPSENSIRFRHSGSIRI